MLQKFETLYQQEYDERIDHIEVNRLASQKQISDMEEVERKILQNLMEEKRFYENERKNKAACRIQVSVVFNFDMSCAHSSCKTYVFVLVYF